METIVRRSDDGGVHVYRGILVPFGKEMLGVYRKRSKFPDGKYLVTEGSNDYYRTISSDGDVKWWHGKTLISSMNQKTQCNGLI